MIVVQIQTSIPSIGARAGNYVAIDVESGEATVFHEPPASKALAALVASEDWTPIHSPVPASDLRRLISSLASPLPAAPRPARRWVRGPLRRLK